MVPFSIIYQGQLRCKAVHGPSLTEIITDAPVDNHGRGGSFSPTDLVATGVGVCMLTTMGIVAERDRIVMDGTRVSVEKHMSPDPPRRIARIVIRMDMAPGVSHEHRSMLEDTARTCPVVKSIHPDINVELSFHYPD